jgi:ABC-2 type transport system permease protein
VVAVAMVLNGVELHESIVLLPLLLLEVYVFALGISFFLSAAFVKYRDVSYIWEVVLQAGFYVTPILYAMSIIPKLGFQKLILLNPMAQAIQDARYSAITHDSRVVTGWRVFDGGWYALIPFVIVVAVVLIGTAFFRDQADSFAENI